MKICMIVGNISPGKCGVGDYTVNLCNHLVCDNYQVDIITTKQLNLEEHYKNHKFKIYDFMKTWDFKSLKKILAFLKNNRYDIVHIQYPSDLYGKNIFINMLPIFIKIFIKSKIVITLHEYVIYTYKGKLRNLLSILFSDKVIVVSKESRNKIVQDAFLFRLSKKIQFIPIVSSIPASSNSKSGLSELRKSFHFSGQDIVLSYFGFINELKGFDVLLNAFKEVSLSNSNVKLLCIANLDENNEFQAKMISLIKSLELKSNIIVTGFINDENVIADLISASDIGVLPFKYGVNEKNSSFLAELNQGILIITTSNNKYGYNEEDNTYLVEPENYKKLVEGINYCINKKMYLSRNKKTLLNWKDIAKETITEYEKLKENSSEKEN